METFISWPNLSRIYPLAEISYSVTTSANLYGAGTALRNLPACAYFSLAALFDLLSAPSGFHLRKQVLAKRDSLSRSSIVSLSSAIHARLGRIPVYQSARWPLLFASFRSEADTISIIEKRLARQQPVLLPKTLIEEKRLLVFAIKSMDDLKPGAYGILEPIESRTKQVDPAIVDLVLVPGSVFDRRGGRYGYGGGFYDRFLSTDAPNAIRIGLAFSFQVMEKILLMPHDQLMDYVVNEKEVILCNRNQVGQDLT